MATHATISQAKGSTGPEVALWRQLLATAGYPTTDAPDYFGQSTHDQTVAWQSANGLDADGVVGPKSWAKMTGEAAPPPTYNQGYGANAAFGRDVIMATWPALISEALSSKYPEVVELAQADQDEPNPQSFLTFMSMAQLEGGYGNFSYKGPNGSKVLNNWGAVQAGKPDAGGNCPAGSWAVNDSGAGGGYVYCYKDYPTPEAGCLSFLRECTVRRPTSWAIARTGDLTAYSIQMHAWTPPLQKLGVGHAGSVQNVDPVTKIPGYFEQPPLGKGGRAQGLWERANVIAGVLGLPVTVSLDGPWEPGDNGASGSGGGGGVLGVNDSLAGAAALVALGGGGWYLYQNGTLGRWWKAAQRVVASAGRR